MAGALVVLVPSVLVGVVWIWYFKTHLRPRKDAPPLVPYLIPWVGSSVQLATDPDTFFANATAKYGPVFGVQAAGFYRYFVTSPTLAKQVHKMPTQFVYQPHRIEMSNKVFGIQKKSIEETDFYEQGFFDMLHRLLSPNQISRDLIPTYAKYAAHEVSTFVPPTTPIPAHDLLYKMLYRASGYAFFGPKFDADGTIDNFIAFDKALPLLTLDLPWPLDKPARDARETLMSQMRAYAEDWTDAGPYIKYMATHARDHGVAHEIPVLCVILLWALEANAPYAAYWTVVLSLFHKDGLAPLVAEVDAERAAWEVANPGLSLALNPDSFVAQAKLPRLSATIQETLRYATSSFSIRRVMEPTPFAGFKFYPGDDLVINNRYAQMDDEYYADPDSFDPSRFLPTYSGGNGPLQSGKDATKDRLANNSMYNAVFGGGVSMCEGRHFAQTELKVFIALLLTQLDITLAPGAKSSDVTLDRSRVGLGVMHPKGDVMLLVKRRTGVSPGYV